MQGGGMLGKKRRRYKLWWSEKDGVVGVGVIVKQELWELR